MFVHVGAPDAPVSGTIANGAMQGTILYPGRVVNEKVSYSGKSGPVQGGGVQKKRQPRKIRGCLGKE